MNNILTSDLKAGMKFTEPVYVDGSNLLVPKGMPLKDKDIQRLLKWGVPFVNSDGEIMADETAAVPEGIARMAFTGLSQREMADIYGGFQDALRSIH